LKYENLFTAENVAQDIAAKASYAFAFILVMEPGSCCDTVCQA
jgi:hypothetical protein